MNVSEILPKGGIPISFSDTAVLLRILYSTGIHSFIHSKIYIAPLQGNYSEALPTPVRTKK